MSRWIELDLLDQEVERQRQAKKNASIAPGGGAIMNVEVRSEKFRVSAEGCESVHEEGAHEYSEGGAQESLLNMRQGLVGTPLTQGHIQPAVWATSSGEDRCRQHTHGGGRGGGQVNGAETSGEKGGGARGRVTRSPSQTSK